MIKDETHRECRLQDILRKMCYCVWVQCGNGAVYYTTVLLLLRSQSGNDCLQGSCVLRCILAISLLGHGTLCTNV